MKQITLSILLFLFLSCVQKREQNNLAKSWNITLADSSSKLSMFLPSNYDTLLIWTHYQCGIPYYEIRLQDKSFPIHEEGGFYDPGIPSRKYQITFEQMLRTKPRILPTREEIIERHNGEVENAVNNPQAVQTQYDTLLLLPNATYSIFANCYHDVKNKGYMQIVTTTVSTSQSFITITFEKSSINYPLDRSAFVNECIDILKTMKFSNGA